MSDCTTDPLPLELAMQAAGLFTGFAAHRELIADRLAKEGMTEADLERVREHYENQRLDDWRAVFAARLKEPKAWMVLLADLDAQRDGGAVGSMACAHGRDRLRQGCHSCDPDVYCPHHVVWSSCTDRDCLAASDAKLALLRKANRERYGAGMDKEARDANAAIDADEAGRDVARTLGGTATEAMRKRAMGAHGADIAEMLGGTP